ncbi:DUF421 domain-containing protein [uncultured Thomasclavelia sp.]|uniref:DUF421 domain-containing protein n=1 Tax=uncultured Thomasclavelia sp. TaxID=3025759 RepID=UPI0025F22414|nr:DUF421 domain-containing protein [uncultured Thomasclavelia sp.]
MSILEVILISLGIYVYLTVLLRFFGKKEFSQLNVFDFVVFLIIAEIMINSLDQEDFTFFHGVVATVTLIVVDRIVSIITMKSNKLRDLFEGKPTYIIFKGKLNQEKMRQQRYTLSDLTHHLRVNNVDSISKVEFALLETNGSLSVVQKDQCDVELPEAIICDGVVDYDNLKLLNRDLNWLKKELQKQGIKHIEDVFCCIPEKGKLFVIKK